MSDYSKFDKFPELKRFMELGGQHTEEGEKYLVENPKLYNQAMEWDLICEYRRGMGDNEKIHKIISNDIGGSTT